MVFVDMDEVLVNFVGAVLKTYNIIDYNPKGCFNLGRILKIDLWEKIDNIDFWTNLTKLPFCDIILERLDKLNHQVYILTSHSGRENVRVGKQIWLKENLPARPYTITTNKSQFAAPGTVLIDDCDWFIDSWTSKGGVGILYPRPWNSDYRLAGQGLETVFKRLEFFT